jgi:hypothetical protein
VDGAVAVLVISDEVLILMFDCFDRVVACDVLAIGVFVVVSKVERLSTLEVVAEGIGEEDFIELLEEGVVPGPLGKSGVLELMEIADVLGCIRLGTDSVMTGTSGTSGWSGWSGWSG